MSKLEPLTARIESELSAVFGPASDPAIRPREPGRGAPIRLARPPRASTGASFSASTIGALVATVLVALAVAALLPRLERALTTAPRAAPAAAPAEKPAPTPAPEPRPEPARAIPVGPAPASPAAPPAPSVAGPEPLSPAAARPPSPETGILALERARAYLATVSSAETAEAVRAFYAPHVRYFGTAATRERVLADKANFFRRWPDRRYTALPEQTRVACRSARTCTVAGMLDWRTANARAGLGASGRASFSLTFTDGLITGETSRVAARDD